MFEGFARLSEEHGLSCNERFLLAATVFCTVSDGEVFSAQELCERLSVSRYLVASGLGALAKAGCILEGLETHSGEVKSMRSYKVTLEASQSVGCESWPGQKKLVEQLLQGQHLPNPDVSRQQESAQPATDGKPPKRKKSEAPLPSMRLTMAILAGSSDMLGRASIDDSRTLRKLTGLSASRLRNHLREASQDLKVLRVVPGASSRWFKPSKQKSIFYLTLLGSLHPDSLILHVSASADVFYDRLRNSKHRAISKLVASMRAEEVALLLSRVTHEVSQLLSQHWIQLDSFKKNCASLLQDSGLIKRLSHFLVVPHENDDISGWPEDLSKSLLGELAFCIVEIACLVKWWLPSGASGEMVYSGIQVRPFRRQESEYFAEIITLPTVHPADVIMISVD